MIKIWGFSYIFGKKIWGFSDNFEKKIWGFSVLYYPRRIITVQRGYK